MLDILLEGSQRAVRLAIEGRSTARGSIPGWLEEAASFDLTAIEDGSTQLAIASRPLREVIPLQVAQMDSAARHENDATGIDVFLRGLKGAIGQELDSEMYDAGLLRTYARFGKVLDRGFDAIEFLDGDTLAVDRVAMDSLAGVEARVPDPRHVRVSGKLEQIQYSDRRFSLLVGDTVVRGIAHESVPAETMGHLFGHDVVVSGQAVFRPSGAVLRLEAEVLEEADSASTLWARIPRPLLMPSAGPSRYHVAQGPRSGVAAIIGRWPGDEDDREIADALERIS